MASPDETKWEQLRRLADALPDGFHIHMTQEVPERSPVVWNIRLDGPMAECHICGEEIPPHWGIPIYEGMVVPNAWPRDWVGVDACQACWQQQQHLIGPIDIGAFRRYMKAHKENGYA
jgi:hypothetical protein